MPQCVKHASRTLLCCRLLRVQLPQELLQPALPATHQPQVNMQRPVHCQLPLVRSNELALRLAVGWLRAAPPFHANLVLKAIVGIKP